MDVEALERDVQQQSARVTRADLAGLGSTCRQCGQAFVRLAATADPLATAYGRPSTHPASPTSSGGRPRTSSLPSLKAVRSFVRAGR
jgi:hypothetical protein